MSKFWEEYSLIIGLLILAVECIILFSSPEDIFRTTVVIDINMYYKTQYERLVLTSLNFYDQSDLERFPATIAGWGSTEFEPTKWELEALQPKVLLLRIYHKKHPVPGKPENVQMNRDIKFVLIHSGNMSSFHDPKVCYKANGFDVTDMGMEVIDMQSATAELPYAREIVVQKGNEKEVVLYWYMWGQGVPRDKQHSIMIRISTPIIFDEDESLGVLKDFAEELFPVMYKQKARSSIIAVLLIEKFGIFGFILDALIIAFPFFVMFRYGRS